jgi:hypothetical protein
MRQCGCAPSWNSARIICTIPEFDALARQVGLKSQKNGTTVHSLAANITRAATMPQ